MSLISEALKKARQEAARQDSAQRGLPYAVGSSEAPARRGLLGPLVAGLGAGAVVVVALGLAAYFGHWGPWKERRGAEVEVAQTGGQIAQGVPPGSAPLGSAPSGPPAPLPGVGEPPPPASAIRDDQLSPLPPALSQEAATAPPVASPAPPRPGAAPPPSPVPQPSPPAPGSAPRLLPGTAGAGEAPPAAGAPAEAPAPPSSTPPAEADEKVYTGELPVPGGGVLHLNGVAFSASPVAVIDGKVMGPGEVVQGFTIVEIQRGRVRLQGHGMSVVVTVR